MRSASGTLTAEQLASLDDPSHRLELVDGSILRMPFNSIEHGRVAAKLLQLLGDFIAERHLALAIVMATGFIVRREPATVRGFDLALLAVERAASIDRSGFVDGAPDLAIEVVDRSDCSDEIEAKVVDILCRGARGVWLVHPRLRTVRAVDARRVVRILGADDTLDGGDLLPGFSLRVGDLFAE